MIFMSLQVRRLVDSPVEQQAGAGAGAGGAARLDVSSNRALSAALSSACRRASSPAAALLIKSLVTRAMSEAKYFSTGQLGWSTSQLRWSTKSVRVELTLTPLTCLPTYPWTTDWWQQPAFSRDPQMPGRKLGQRAGS